MGGYNHHHQPQHSQEREPGGGLNGGGSFGVAPGSGGTQKHFPQMHQPQRPQYFPHQPPQVPVESGT